MHKGIIAVILSFGLMAATPTPAETNGGNINFFLGAKALDENDWLADQHGEFGILFDYGPESWPVQLAVGMLYSRGEFDGYFFAPSSGFSFYDQDVNTREFNLGVRKYWGPIGSMYPYLGGGLAHIRLKAEERFSNYPPFSDSGDGTGLWLDGGLMWRFNQFNIGFNIRSSSADVTINGRDFEAGGGHAGLMLGYHW